MDIKWLIKKLDSYKENDAIIWKDKSYKYEYLLNKKRDWTNILKKEEISNGQVVALEGDYSPSICALMIALIENDNIIVPLSSSTEENKNEFMKIANVAKSFIFDEEDNWKMINRGHKIENNLIKKLIKEGDPGLVLFSSGSTGKSKGAILNFRKILEKYKRQQKTLRTLVFLLIDHIGGINTLFYIIANGGTMVIAESKQPSRICEAIEKHRVELLPTSPTFINLLLISEDYKKYDLSSLQMMTYGTEPMPEFTLKRANEIFSNITLKQTYGLSELGIMSTKSESNSSLWVKLGGEGYQLKVVEGILWIKAEMAMLGYLNAPSPFDKEGWFNTQDIVQQKGEYYKILGRESEIINIGGEKVYPAEIESCILELHNIKDVIIRGEPNPIMGNIVHAKVTLNKPEELASVKKRVREHCYSRLEKYKVPVKIEVTNSILHNDRFKKMRTR